MKMSDEIRKSTSRGGLGWIGQTNTGLSARRPVFVSDNSNSNKNSTLTYFILHL